MSLLVITGISGAGKTLVSDTLEDIGFNCIDNLPPELLVSVSRISDVDKLAVIIDGRSKQKYDDLLKQLEQLKQEGIDYHLLFLDCEKDVVLGRYKYTRRPHPLLSDQLPTLEQAIEHEIEMSAEIRDRADLVIDTSHLQAAQLKKMIVDTFQNTDYHGMTIKIITFGYKNGIPSDADLLFDVRCVPNPYYKPELKNLSGNDQPVVDYIFSFPQAEGMISRISDFISYSLPLYIEEGKKELVIGVGCTSGHHRSVAFANSLKERLSSLKYPVVILNRDIDKGF